MMTQKLTLQKNIKLKPVNAPDIDQKCSRCALSICCNSINQKIQTPKSREDFDFLLWQISHAGVNLFKDADGWFLHIATKCDHLLTGGICAIYEKRPMVCREYTNSYCEFDAPISQTAELFFSSYQELDMYCEKRFKSWSTRFRPL